MNLLRGLFPDPAPPQIDEEGRRMNEEQRIEHKREIERAERALRDARMAAIGIETELQDRERS